MSFEPLLQAATPGPWFANIEDTIGGFQVANRDCPASELDTRPGSPDRCVAIFLRKPDADLIALAPDALRLLDQAAELIEDLDAAPLTRCSAWLASYAALVEKANQ